MVFSIKQLISNVINEKVRKEQDVLKKLNDIELKEVKGGIFGSKLIMSLVTGGAFIIGLIDGFLRPLKCRH